MNLATPGLNGRCYQCFRPIATCFCACIPAIDNQTEILILQHRREQFHPFNTARIVKKSLRNSRLIAGFTTNFGVQLPLKPQSGLLFPGPAATLISELPRVQAPEQLVILDGTWHHAKMLFRAIPALHSLPRYQLAPALPSRFRIRRQPNLASLSTLEAVVSALQILEPDTAGFDQLLRAFDTMVEAQLAHPRSPQGQRCKQRRIRTLKNIPLALLGNLDNIVVAYGEAAAGQRGLKRVDGPPIAWTAQRLSNGETFSCTLNPPRPLDDVFLKHLALSRADFDSALSLPEARLRWAQFRRPGDIVAVFHPGTARLFSFLAENDDRCLVLKSANVESHFSRLDWDRPVPAQNLRLAAPHQTSRAGRRLAHVIAFVRGLNDLVQAQTPELAPPSPLSILTG